MRISAGTEADYSDEPVVRFLREIQNLKDDRRAVVLVTNGILELFIETLVKARCKNGKRITNDNRGYPYSAKLIILHECGVLDDDTFAALDWFRKLRNRAAHEPFFEITVEDLKALEDSAQAKPLGELCVNLVAGFWNHHLAILGPVFAPRIVQRNE